LLAELQQSAVLAERQDLLAELLAVKLKLAQS